MSDMFKTGDILSVRHHFNGSMMSIVQGIIRMITGGTVDHTAIILVDDDGIHVVEASFDTGVHKTPFMEWIKKNQPKIVYHQRRHNVNHKMISELINSTIGKKKYDKLGIIQQLAYQVSRRFKNGFRWIGRTENGKADERFYCSEFVGWCHDLDHWWLLTPGDIKKVHGTLDVYG